ncbi:Arrestin domain-containing protein 4 [Larimichthys crocea]|uniref:Uncharacterized protein n=1 Tax=Larimichthys crocea TaxID=215358 RepID=A0ACD3Q7Y4_LARCR|nr:Arrestin domain-containing protein 4 [Larimichthys crocea]
MKKDKKATAYLTLVRNEDPRSDPVLMIPQCKVSVKKMLFTSGTVSMDVYTERMAFYQGEGIKVVAAIQNKSTRDIWPKYRFYMKQSFFVKRKKKIYLDIKYALDPEIKFPIVILPALKAEEQHHRPAYPVYGSGTSANSYAAGRTNFLQNSTASGPSAPPPSYGTYALYPSTNFRGKY